MFQPSGSGSSKAAPVRKDKAWKHGIPGSKKEVTCIHCKIKYNGGGINRLKYHIAQIECHDAKPCKKAPPEAIREVQAQLEEFQERKELKRKQMAAIGGEASSNPRPPFPRFGSSGGASVSIGPRIRKNKSTLDSLIVPRTTPGAQPSLESMGWNKEKHDVAKMAIGDFWFYNNIPFHAARSPYWQIMVDAIIGCGQGFKAPNDEEIKGPILNQKLVDVKAKIAEQHEIWRKKGCTIMTNGWTNRRSRTLLNFLVSSGSTVFLKSIDASGNVKNAEYLCGLLEEALEDVGEENVVQIVIDNATNYVVAGKLLMERHPTLFWTPCATHCIDLILEELGKIPWIKTCVEAGRNICKYIYNHAWVLNLMRNFTNKKELSRPGITRFATNFIMLQSLLQSKAELKCMFVSEEWTTSSYAKTTAGIDTTDQVFEEHSFWQQAKEIVS